MRDSETTWRDARKQLKRDHRWELASLLDKEDRERLFTSHTSSLVYRKKEKFDELLDETKGVSSKPEIIHPTFLTTKATELKLSSSAR